MSSLPGDSRLPPSHLSITPAHLCLTHVLRQDSTVLSLECCRLHQIMATWTHSYKLLKRQERLGFLWLYSVKSTAKTQETLLAPPWLHSAAWWTRHCSRSQVTSCRGFKKKAVSGSSSQGNSKTCEWLRLITLLRCYSLSSHPNSYCVGLVYFLFVG